MAKPEKLQVDLIVGLKGLVSGLKEGAKQVQGWAKNVSKVVGVAQKAFRKIRNAAIAVTAAIVGIVGSWLYLTDRITAAGDDIAKASQKLGIPADTLSALQFAAGRANVDMGELTVGLRTLGRLASENTGEAAEWFTKLGIGVKDANGNTRPLFNLFLDTAEAISKMTNETDRLAAAQTLFGRSGSELIPLLTEGRTGLIALIMEAIRLGAVWSPEQAVNAERYQDAITDIKAAWGGLWREVVMEAVPRMLVSLQTALTWLLANRDWLVEKIGSVVRWVMDRFGEVVAYIVAHKDEIITALTTTYEKAKSFGESIVTWWNAEGKAMMGDVLHNLDSVLKALVKIIDTVARFTAGTGTTKTVKSLLGPEGFAVPSPFSREGLVLLGQRQANDSVLYPSPRSSGGGH